MSAPWLIEKPAVPSQWDDEFEAPALDPRWTIATGGNTFTYTYPLDPYNVSAETVYRYNIHQDRTSWLMMQPRSGAAFSVGFEQDLTGLPTNCFLYARASVNVRRNTATDGDGEVFLRVYNNGTEGTNDFLVGFDTFGGIVEGFCQRVVGGASTNLGLLRNYIGEVVPYEYIGIQKVGAVYHGWIASAAGNWVWMGTATFGADNFNRVRLIMNNAVVTTPGRMIVGADYFRVLSGKGPP